MTPGQRLRRLREEKGLNPRQFAARVNAAGRKVSEGYIYNLERGTANSEHVGLHFLRAFTQVLEVRDHVLTSSLLDGEIEKSPARVLMREVLETFLASEGRRIKPAEADALRKLADVSEVPRWAQDWPAFHEALATYTSLQGASEAGLPWEGSSSRTDARHAGANVPPAGRNRAKPSPSHQGRKSAPYRGALSVPED